VCLDFCGDKPIRRWSEEQKAAARRRNLAKRVYRTAPLFADELIEREHGAIGTDSRNEYEEKAQMFIVSEMLKEARLQANLTQEQLAERSGTKKSYISKIENGKGNIQLATLIRIFEKGLNKRIGLTFL
jgi:DNA-binding XRE family transcriptional regulator